MQEGLNWLRAVFAQFRRDVFDHPSVAPVAAWLISALIGLVGFLTWRFAATAAERARQPGGLDESGIITEAWGYRTIAIVAALALIAGWEPIVARRLGPRLGRFTRALRNHPRKPIKWVVLLVAAPLGLIWRLPSMLFSFVDWCLVRPVAWVAGVRIADWVGPRLSPFFRYAILTFWIIGPIALSLHLSRPGTEPTMLAVWSLAPGFLAVFAVVRRWQWVEGDREAFLIERGGPARRRVGFQEDLRDEALTAMVGLFILIPLALMQVNQLYDAFDLYSADGVARTGEPSLWQWIGFFGAELAKSVPFVDWSEVYHVDNGSPIKAHDDSGLGATLVFLLRATLDLLLLAALLQAVQIAARLRDQNAAFLAGRLPILDPFAELTKFRPLGERDFESRPVLGALSDAVADFPIYGGKYGERRLAQIVAGQEEDLRRLIGPEGDDPRSVAPSPVERDEMARDAAMLLLAGQYPRGEQTAPLLAAIASRPAPARSEPLTLRRRRALTLLAETSPKEARVPLEKVAEDGEADPALRLMALRELGRLRLASADGAAARLAAEEAGDPLLRAHAALALVKAGHREAVGAALESLAPSLVGEAAMAAAYGLGLLGGYTTARHLIATRFAESERKSAERAARSGLGELDRDAKIPSGNFEMGAGPDEKSAPSDEYPQHKVAIAYEFGMGVCPVTFEEYDAFCDATGAKRPSDEGWGRGDRPVIHVSWNDAHDYIEWINAWMGERHRLPSEAEWEYAARGGTSTPYWWGDEASDAFANYGRKVGKTTPVGTYPANPFGLHDMHGNVWEWCADPWHDTYDGAPDHGAVWSVGATSSSRVLRGGSWYAYPLSLRSAYRLRNDPTYRFLSVGFRLARSLEP